MRIGITGSQGVGKTTLLNALRSEDVFKEFKIANEVTRELADIVKINEEGNQVTQSLIMNKHAFNILAYDNMLTDRTPLDCFLYTVYLDKKNKQYNKDIFGYTFIEDQFNQTKRFMKYYDALFYIRPEFELQADEHRSGSRSFAEAMTKLFENAYRDIMPQFEIPIIVLSGSVRERVTTVLSYMESI